MLYTIVGIVVLILLLNGKSRRNILYNPRINSTICIVYICWILITGVVTGKLTVVMLLFWGIALIDCIKDIIVADDYYGNIGNGIDPLYRVKSLTTLFSYALSRVVFLLIVEPYICLSAHLKLQKMMKVDKIIPVTDNWGKCELYNKIFKNTIKKKLDKGTLLANRESIDAEYEMSLTKLENAYPQNLLEKLGDILSKDKKIEMERENAKKELILSGRFYVYVDTCFYNSCKHEFSKVLKQYGTLSPQSIVQLEELKCLNILKNQDIFKKSSWGEHFVIFVMNSLVKDGIMEEFDLSDNILENHQYRHKEGKTMVCRNAEDNPLLALNDD